MAGHSHTSVLASGNLFKSILSHFPTKSRYAFAYGSGVFQQKDQGKGKMVDIIFVVDSPVDWHRENLQRNFDHYSGIRRFGPNMISKIQERMACGVYYNPFVEVGGNLIKYGVVSTASFEDDLTRWTHLYLAGRLHKPVLEILPDSSGTSYLNRLIDKNRDAALRAALLLNSRCLRKTDLYYTIAELSYMGDFRMAVGEHPDKVRNIVTPLIPQFDHIYYPLIEKLKPFVKIDKHGVVTQDVGANGILYQLMGLPHPIQRSLARRIHRDPKVNDIEDAMVELSHLPHVARYLRKSIAEVVWGSSILQTVQGIVTAGLVRSIKYGWEKVSKKLKADKSKTLVASQPEVAPVVNPLPLKIRGEESSERSGMQSKIVEESSEKNVELIPVSASTNVRQSGRKSKKPVEENVEAVKSSKTAKAASRKDSIKRIDS